MWSQILKNGLLEKLTTASTEENQKSPKARALNEAVDYFKNKGDFELYSGVQAMKSLRFERQQHEKNREAEEAHARKHVWGYEDDSDDGEEMAEEFVNFGEINITQPNINSDPSTPDQPQPTAPQPQQPVQPPPAQKPNGTPTWLKWALAAAIGASAAGPAITAYVMRPTEEQAGGSIFRFDTELPPWMKENGD